MDLYVHTGISKEHSASIFRADDEKSTFLRMLISTTSSHGVSTRKTNMDIFTTVRISNLILVLLKHFPTSLGVISRTVSSCLNSNDAAVLPTRLATGVQLTHLT
jgi:hypothetical protein